MKRISFPYRLFQLLEHVDKSPDLQAIISWQPHGRSFLIKDKQRLEDEVLPLFFATGNYDSFRRSLNFWGFVQIRGVNSPDFKSYYHKFFLRARMDLCSKLKRQKSGGKVVSIEASPCPLFEPKFHDMEWMPVLTTARHRQQDEIQQGQSPSSGEDDAHDRSEVNSFPTSSSGYGPRHPFAPSYSNRTVNMPIANTDVLVSARTRRIDYTAFTTVQVNNKERTHSSIITTSTEAEETKPSYLYRAQEGNKVSQLPMDHIHDEDWYYNLWQGFVKEQKCFLPNDLSELNSVFD